MLLNTHTFELFDSLNLDADQRLLHTLNQNTSTMAPDFDRQRMEKGKMSRYPGPRLNIRKDVFP